MPGFVVATELIPGGRRVTFGNGLVVDEPIIDSNDELRRLAWTAVSDAMPLTHYNSSVQVFARDGGSRIVWTADMLPDEAAATVGQMMEQGAQVMARTLDGLRSRPRERRAKGTNRPSIVSRCGPPIAGSEPSCHLRSRDRRRAR